MTDEQEERILSEIGALRAMLEERLPKPKAKARPNTVKGKYGEHKNVRLSEKEYEALREPIHLKVRSPGEHGTTPALQMHMQTPLKLRYPLYPNSLTEIHPANFQKKNGHCSGDADSNDN